MLVVSVYYRPQCNSKTTDTYDWITHLFSLNFSGPIIIVGDFNAKSSLWGYSHSDIRGKLLEQALELSSLELRNEPFVPTRVGLHTSQRDTTPDLTITTPGIIKKWHTQDSTWGSDHFPIFLHLNSKKLRPKHTYTVTNWNLFRSFFQINARPDLPEFLHAVSDARTSAAESVIGTVEVDNPDIHMHRLLRTAQCPTR